MPLELDFSTEPMEAGESRALTLRSELAADVQIRCFVNPPPRPGGYLPCKECGSFKIKRNETRMITAGAIVFGANGGRLEIDVTDTSGQSERIRLKVRRRDEAAAGALVKEEVKI